MKPLSFFLFLLALGGCASFISVVNLDELPAEGRGAVESVRIYSSAQLAGVKYEVVDTVEGHSCQSGVFGPAASGSAAIEQARYHAYKKGANGITNIRFGPRGGMLIPLNCWAVISCTADAIKVHQ